MVLYQQNNLYQQRVNVGLDPQEVFAQAREFETSVHGQAQAMVQEARDQAQDDARGEHVVGQAQQAVLEAQAIAKAAAGVAIEQARAELRAEVQQWEQLFQRRESELEAQIRMLQHEITTLRHQDRPTSPVTQVVHNGAELVNVAELVSTIADLRAEVQNLKGMSSPNQTRASAPRGIGAQPSAETRSTYVITSFSQSEAPHMPESSLGMLPTLRGTGSLGHSGYSAGQPRIPLPLHRPSDSIHPHMIHRRQVVRFRAAARSSDPPDPPPDRSPDGSQGSGQSRRSRGWGRFR